MELRSHSQGILRTAGSSQEVGKAGRTLPQSLSGEHGL